MKKSKQSTVSEVIDLVDKPHNTRCLNPSCDGKSDYCFAAPDFILTHYRVKRSKSFKEEICDHCYKIAVKVYDDLCTAVFNGDLMLKVNFVFSSKIFWNLE